MIFSSTYRGFPLMLIIFFADPMNLCWIEVRNYKELRENSLYNSSQLLDLEIFPRNFLQVLAKQIANYSLNSVSAKNDFRF